MRILLLDDDNELREVVALHLKDQGHEVNDFEDPEEALASLLECHYDIVITDFNMPRMNGIEFSKRVKAERPDQRIWMASNNPSPSVADSFLSAGGEQFYPKMDVGSWSKKVS